MLEDVLQTAKAAARTLSQTSTSQRNSILSTMAELVREHASDILNANHHDVATAKQAGLDPTRSARLMLSEAKLDALATGLATVAQLPDPLGRGERWTLPNGLVLERARVPLGAVGLIYESRPGVTIEAVSLALKSGNSIILRGGREAHASNHTIAELWRSALSAIGLPPTAVQLLSDPDRSLARALMHLDGLDLLIPRGGAALIQTVVQEATVPVIETGVGNCHLYVDRDADMAMAVRILRDGKVGNPSVCNALETVLVHREAAHEFLVQAAEALSPYGVVWHGDPTVSAVLSNAVPASDEDWSEEYLGLHLAARVVDDVDAAIDHITQYGTHHSESIVTNNYATGQHFLSAVDAAVVYWNASTRFSDGNEFGFGAEVGISTQKLHARGPMGLDALTTMKTTVYGSGQTRDIP